MKLIHNCSFTKKNNKFKEDKLMSNFYNTFVNPVAGQTFNGVQPQNIKFTQPLTKDEAAELTKSDAMFSLKVTSQEINRGLCTHKYPGTNKFSIAETKDDTGDVVCTICGARLNPDDLTHEKVEQIVKDFKNVMECCKLMYVNIPETVVRQLFTILPFVDKIPKLYDIAVENYSRFAPSASSTQDVYMQNNGLFNSFREITNGGTMGYPMYNMGGMPQQPAYPGYGYQQPVSPMMNNQGGMTYGAPDMNANPFYANGVAPAPIVNAPVPPMGMPQTYSAPTQPQQNYPVYGAQNQQMAQPAPAPAQPATPDQQTTVPANGAVERVNATGTLEA